MFQEKRATAAEKETQAKETGRIEAFSDGVFGVAITLLAFNLNVPKLAHPSAEGLSTALFIQWPSYIAFITSFATILIMWVSHHNLFKLVNTSDQLLLYANGLLLLLVTVVPFTTSLISLYLNTPAAATASVVYAGVYALINIAYNLLRWTIMRHDGRLLISGVSLAQFKVLTRKLLLGLPLYSIATLAAFWNQYVTLAICSALWIYWSFSSFERVHASAVTTASTRPVHETREQQSNPGEPERKKNG